MALNPVRKHSIHGKQSFIVRILQMYQILNKLIFTCVPLQNLEYLFITTISFQHTFSIGVLCDYSHTD